jgi:hypothetical protein
MTFGADLQRRKVRRQFRHRQHQHLHEARIALGRFAPHAVVEVEDAQPWPQSFVRPQGQQEVDGISATRHGYPNTFRR